MDGPKAAKKRKITDKNIPNVILQNPDFAQDSRMYQDLLEMERKLDWTMMRKRSEIQDTLTRNPSTSRTLRLFLSHSVSGQLWQGGGDITANFETGEGIPAWAFKLEGRLLEPPTQRARDKTQRKFSTLIKRMIIEMDRDPSLYPEGNIVEWPQAPGHSNPALDGFTVRRTGDAPTKLRVILYLEHYPEQYKVVGDLSNILGIKSESRIGAIQALWNYIKVQGLQDKTDRRMIRADDQLRPLFGGEQIYFQQLPELVNRYLTQPDPVLLHYTIDPSIQPPERPQAWDVEIKMEDLSLKNRMAAMVVQTKESSQTLAKMDDEISLLAQSLHNSHLKKTFLESFANDPAKAADRLWRSRLSYDAAAAKHEKMKTGKKEKERREAEEELEKARERYDETSQDVQTQMHAIQDQEMSQLRELTGFLDLEVNFVEQYLNVLKEVKDEWYDETSLEHVPPRRTTAPPHVFVHPSRTSGESDHELSRKSPKIPTVASTPPSRPASRMSRKRSDSGATVNDKSEKDKDKASRRMSVAGWASNAVGSVTGRGKKKDKDTFASLQDDSRHEEDVDDDGMRSSPKKTGTLQSLTRKLSRSKETSPKPSPKILKPPSLQDKKAVRATHSFTGAADELSFVAGEEITVLNEVLDDWWMGELNGRKGLFPTTYVEVLPSRPVLPRRPEGTLKATALSTIFSPTESVHILKGHVSHNDDDSISYASTDFDDDHDFGKQPLSAHHNASFLTGPAANDSASVISSLEEGDGKLLAPFSETQNFDSGFDDDFYAFKSSKNSLPPMLPPSRPPPVPRRATENAITSLSVPGKKAPPPPPPRRSTSAALGPSPPIPERSYKLYSHGRSKVTPPSSISSYDRSPFESAAELTTPDTIYHDNEVNQNCPFGRLVVLLRSSTIPSFTTPKGKSSLVKQFIDNHFVDAYYPTIETTSAKTVTYKGVQYDCHIIDTAGQDEYSPVNAQHAIGIHGYVLVYSITSRASFDMIQIVYDKIVDFCGVTDIPCVIAGSKCDLHQSRQVQFNEGQKLAKDLNAAFQETSAKENKNVARVFELCLEEIEKRSLPNQTEPQASRCVVM
ncbi:hypothetical protein H0H93_013936 [Arthromyces matolae]|nr:hypothetical protein H0H93_013936 [Arthromyces matolae]